MGVGVGVGAADVDIERVDINMGMAPSTDAGEMRDDKDAERDCRIEERVAAECGGVVVGRSNGLAECKQAAWAESMALMRRWKPNILLLWAEMCECVNV